MEFIMRVTIWIIAMVLIWSDALAQQLPRWTLAPEWRIGTLHGDMTEAFVQLRPGCVRNDRHGNVYVLDRGASYIRKSDDAGRYVTRIGNRGQGPGEFVEPTAFVFIGDILWVMMSACEGSPRS
jgi:hypothetical protein